MEKKTWPTEPPIMHAVMAMAQNQATSSLYQPKEAQNHLFPVTLWERLAGNFLSFDPSRFANRLASGPGQ